MIILSHFGSKPVFLLALFVHCFVYAYSLPKVMPTVETKIDEEVNGDLMPDLHMSCTNAANEDDCLDVYMHPNLPANRFVRHTIDTQEKISDYWLQRGMDFVKEKQVIAEQSPRNIAKNLVLMIGDGMSLSTIFATRVYLGGEQVNLAFEEFPDTGLARTYAIDRLVADSASTATAYLSGSKTRYGTLGVNGHVKRGDCAAALNTTNYVPSIAEWALKAGKSVGLVTTASITDATPAALYAHSADRDWENDAMVHKACGKKSGINDIAEQLLNGYVGTQLSVVLGGGRANFLDRELFPNGKRCDQRNLIEEYLMANNANVYVQNREQLLAVNAVNLNRLWGLFADQHLSYKLLAPSNEPSLEEMTQIAIDVLKQNPNGYLLFVEGALIDEAHHVTQPRLALDETAEFNKAVALVRAQTNQADTLIVVSADHSHTLTVSGYAQRSHDIFDITNNQALDETPYLTLSYANGPAAAQYFSVEEHHRLNPKSILSGQVTDRYPATVPLFSETHDAEDVPVYALGPWSHLFSGIYEQSTIPYLMAYAACLGDSAQILQACDN